MLPAPNYMLKIIPHVDGTPSFRSEAIDQAKLQALNILRSRGRLERPLNA